MLYKSFKASEGVFMVFVKIKTFSAFCNFCGNN